MPRFPIPQEKWTGSGYKWLDWTGEAYHPGIDINTGAGNTDLGEPVFCHDWGVVHKIDRADGGYGNQVIVQHNGYFSRYAHLMNDIMVHEGELTTPFTHIGKLGKTGAAASAHNHFELPTEKLITYLKSIRPNDWFRFYPNGKPKAWVQEHYLNPNTSCTRTIRLLNVFYDTAIPSGFQYIENLKKWVYESSGTQLRLEVEKFATPARANPIPWVKTTFRDGVVGAMIDQAWLRYWILAQGSNYDIVALHLKEEIWKGEAVIAYSPVPKQLGIQPIVSRCEDGIDHRYSEFCGGDAFIGKLRHEIGHTIFSACRQQGIDSVHILEPLHKLEDIFTTVRLAQYEGFRPNGGLRMFVYGGVPTKKVIEFSGVPTDGRVYRTSDYRLFFLYENGWKQINESAFEAAVKSRHEYTEMSVEEGNWIMNGIGGVYPEYVGGNILEQVAETLQRQNILKKAGWKTLIPISHL